MLQRITDLWPNLLRQYQRRPGMADDASDEAAEALPDNDEAIEETFKGLRWTRVIALREYEQASQHTYDMVDDILDGHQQMNAIKLDRLP